MTSETPSDATVIRGMTALPPDECDVCKEKFRFGGWMMVHGRAKCGHCDAPHQIRPMSEQEWDDVPYLNLKEEFIEPVKEYYEETGNPLGDGFDQWLRRNYPGLVD